MKGATKTYLFFGYAALSLALGKPANYFNLKVRIPRFIPTSVKMPCLV